MLGKTIYRPIEKTIEYERTEPHKESLYCGEELSDLAIILFQLSISEVTLQDAYNRVINHINKIQIEGIVEQVGAALEKAIEDGLIQENNNE